MWTVEERERRRVEAKERFDEAHGQFTRGETTHDQLSRAFNEFFIEAGEPGGYPILTDEVEVLLEETFPDAHYNGHTTNSFQKRNDWVKDTAYFYWELSGRQHGHDQDHWYRACELYDVLREYRPEGEGHEIVNQWYSKHLRRDVLVLKDPETGKSFAEVQDEDEDVRYNMLFLTFYVGRHWSAEAEEEAQKHLRGMISDDQWHCYFLQGMFLERSKASNIDYLLRKGRPTIATKAVDGRPMVALCSHPTGYYAGTFAGILCPTDDVIAHLLMIRNDEHRLWKKATHHPIHESLSGV